jgi:hypothetical protein
MLWRRSEKGSNLDVEQHVARLSTVLLVRNEQDEFVDM